MQKISLALIGAALLLGACATQPTHGLQPGLVAIHEGRYSDAEQHFQGMLAKEPSDPYAALNLGVAQARQGNNGEAAQSYREAIRIGRNAPVRSIVRFKYDRDVTSTVGEVARNNLALIGG